VAIVLVLLTVKDPVVFVAIFNAPKIVYFSLQSIFCKKMNKHNIPTAE
jgi:hypothetical protein